MPCSNGGISLFIFIYHTLNNKWPFIWFWENSFNIPHCHQLNVILFKLLWCCRFFLVVPHHPFHLFWNNFWSYHQYWFYSIQLQGFLVGNFNFWFQFLGPLSKQNSDSVFNSRDSIWNLFLNSAVEKSTNRNSDSKIWNFETNAISISHHRHRCHCPLPRVVALVWQELYSNKLSK